MHKIAQNCIQNDQKLSAGVEEVGVAEKRGVRRENWGKSAMAVGGIDAPGYHPQCGHHKIIRDT